MAPPMAKSLSRAELEEAYKQLLKLEIKAHNLLEETSDPPLDGLEKIMETQGKLMKKIEASPAVDAQALEDDNSEVSKTIKMFVETREKTRQALKDQMGTFKKRLESLDQSEKIMRHYLQGGKRPEEKSSLRIDENR